MAEIPVNQTPQQNQQTAGKGLSWILMAGFVIFFLLLLLILNYFNILPLSKLSPNYLGFLPHRPYIQSLKLETTNSKTGFPTSIPNFSPNIFQYDTEKANTILTKYIKDNVKPEFIPENLDIKRGLTIDNRIDENLKQQFGIYLENNNENITIIFNFVENTNTPNIFMIFIHPKETKQPTLNATLANSLLSTYFRNPIPIKDCNTKGTTSSCKEINIESEGKREFGALIGQDTSKSPVPASTVFSCFIPKESSIYDALKSCISPS